MTCIQKKRDKWHYYLRPPKLATLLVEENKNMFVGLDNIKVLLGVLIKYKGNNNYEREEIHKRKVSWLPHADAIIASCCA